MRMHANACARAAPSRQSACIEPLQCRSRTKTSKDVGAMRHEEVAVARIVHTRVRSECSATQFAVVPKPGRRVVLVRSGYETRMGLKRVGRPFPDGVAPREPLPSLKDGRVLPLPGGRQSRGKYACACCQTIQAAPMPAQMIDKGIPAPGLLAQVVVAKHDDHLPLYRQS